MNFSSALNALQQNMEVRRESWPDEILIKKTILGDGDKSSLVISGKHGQVPWVASSEEILATDWTII